MVCGGMVCSWEWFVVGNGLLPGMVCSGNGLLVGWLVGWLVGCLGSWLVGWLIGWLAGWFG